MNQIELLKKLPKEHWTEHNGKSILIKDLLDLLLNEENINNGSTGRGENNPSQTSSTNDRRRSPKRRRDQKRNP